VLFLIISTPKGAFGRAHADAYDEDAIEKLIEVTEEMI
jgi:hypothetical protein